MISFSAIKIIHFHVPDTCKVAPEFRHMIKPCSSWYGYFAEDTGQYDIAWHPLKNESLYRPPFSFKSWEFYTSGELDSVPMMGKIAWKKMTRNLIEIIRLHKH